MGKKQSSPRQTKSTSPPPALFLPMVNARAAGIDVGSKTHYRALGQRPEDVYAFGVTTTEHQRATSLLHQHHITTIAMESTGSYWQPLFHALQEAGFEVLLVNGSQTKNVRGKTDVKDCQWIQKLHSLGLLSGSFLPASAALALRTITRHRTSLTEAVAQYTLKVQKCLRLMNLRLDVAIRDVAGKSGRAIVEAILGGERSGAALAALADPRVKTSQAQIEELLQGQWDEALLYELKDCWELMDIHNGRIEACDRELAALLTRYESTPGQQQAVDEATPPAAPLLAKKQDKGKHAPKGICLQQHCYRILGTDIYAVPGIGPGVALQFIAEMGTGIHQFGSAKQFASWLGLAPNNRISGGKVLSSRTEKTRHRPSKALRDAANAIGLSKGDDALIYFFRRIAFKNGRGAAITATARKLAVILWTMIVHKMPYQTTDSQAYQDALKARKLRQLKRDVKKHAITMAELSTLF
jgi:transposase